MTADGYAFYLSVNGVWLTKEVPVRYLKKESGDELAIAVKIADLTNNSDFTRFGASSPEELSGKDRRRWK